MLYRSLQSIVFTHGIKPYNALKIKTPSNIPYTYFELTFIPNPTRSSTNDPPFPRLMEFACTLMCISPDSPSETME